jgi:hypothetical protein
MNQKKRRPRAALELKTGGVEQSGQEPLDNPEEQDENCYKT